LVLPKVPNQRWSLNFVSNLLDNGTELTSQAILR